MAAPIRSTPIVAWATRWTSAREHSRKDLPGFRRLGAGRLRAPGLLGHGRSALSLQRILRRGDGRHLAPVGRAAVRRLAASARRTLPAPAGRDAARLEPELQRADLF